MAVSGGKLLLMADTSDKKMAHALLEQLEAGQLSAVVQLLRVMTDPLSSAPVEDEEISSETAEAIERARASLGQGKGISHEDMLHEFGIPK